MIVYLAVLAIQVMLIIDVIRNGRNQLWIMALMFLPGPSTIAYLVIEVYPRLRGNRHVRTVRAKAVAALDPEREVRAARDALDLADTAANRIRLTGEEGRCRYAALLLEQGWDNKARVLLEEVEARMKRLDRQQRAAEADMYRWAMDRLGELRAGR